MLDFTFPKGQNENFVVNDQIQMRSYFLGLDQAMADNDYKLLVSDSKKNTVTLVVPESIDTQAIQKAYSKYAAKVQYAFDMGTLCNNNAGSSPNNLGTAFVINVFRACAKEKKIKHYIAN